MKALALAVILLASPVVAQQPEIFIPGAQSNAQATPAPAQNRLAGCLANPSASRCTGVQLDAYGISLESAPGVPEVAFETLVLDLNANSVTSTPAPPPQAPDYSAPVPPGASLALPAVAITVAFDFDSATIRADQIGKVVTLATALQDPALANTAFAVIGHTDARGSGAYNCTLSERRASEVAQALRSAAVPLPLYPVGFGEHVLKNPVSPEAAENRRVTFLRLPQDAQAVLGLAHRLCP